MANEEQLSILKQGVRVWNKWREENLGAEIDLSRAKLSRAKLRNARLSEVDFSGADLSGTDLRGAELLEANLKGAILKEANLRGAIFRKAILREADISGADLAGALLLEADLTNAVLRKANLRKAFLTGSILIGANLTGAILMETDLAETFFVRRLQVAEVNFCNVDLSETKGLENVRHLGPSTIGIDTIAKSKGQIPEVFLQGCGLSDWEIEISKLYKPDLSNEQIQDIQYRMYDLRANRALQISPLFISYSHIDSDFVDKIGACLTEIGTRYWRDIHDMKAGSIEEQVGRAIRQNQIVILVLSEHSTRSKWVKHEVRTAWLVEKDTGRKVLCPIALDDSWKSSPWPKRIIERILKYNIIDFSAWKDDRKFDEMFHRLIDGLELFYKR